MSEDMPHSSEMGLDEDGFEAGGFSTVQDFKVGDMILPMHSHYIPVDIPSTAVETGEHACGSFPAS